MHQTLTFFDVGSTHSTKKCLKEVNKKSSTRRRLHGVFL